MKIKSVMSVGIVAASLLGIATLGRGQGIKATPEITEQLKKAHAYWCQGWYEKALALALPIYQKHHDIWVAWFPTWVYRGAKGPLPNPYHKSEIMRMRIEARESGRPFRLHVSSANARSLVAYSYFCLGRYQEALPIFEEMRRQVGNAPAIMSDDARICRQRIAEGHRPPQPPAKSTWKPLTLRFQEEDYFVLVPLEEASKLLGFSSTITPNAKVAGGKGIRLTIPHKPNVVWRFFVGYPEVERLENGKGEPEGLLYATIEKDGDVWVPFYWLARKANIRWWEVRNGKIYIAPKSPSGSDSSVSPTPASPPTRK